MDQLRSARFLPHLSCLEQTSREQVIIYLQSLHARAYAPDTEPERRGPDSGRAAGISLVYHSFARTSVFDCKVQSEKHSQDQRDPQSHRVHAGRHDRMNV